MMVAAHNSDLQAAQTAGMQTAFVRRPAEHGFNQQQDLKAIGQWSLEADSMTGLADRLTNF
jgi:2-haloacid dehalogenase